MAKHTEPYQPLFDLMTDHGLTLLLGEMQEIVEVCSPLIESGEIDRLNGIIEAQYQSTLSSAETNQAIANRLLKYETALKEIAPYDTPFAIIAKNALKLI